MIIAVEKDCLKCQYHKIINPDDPKNIKIRCEKKDKEYRWGQRIDCEEKTI